MRPSESVESFRQWQEELASRLDPEAKAVIVCGGAGCGAFGSEGIRESFQTEIDRRGLQDQVSVKTTGCHGLCEKGPVVVTLPEHVFCPGVRSEDVPEILEKTAEKYREALFRITGIRL